MPRPGIADVHRPAVSGDDGRRVRNYAAVDTFKEFLQAEHARGLEAKPEAEEPLREFLMPADDERPKPYRWQFMTEAPPGFPQGSDDDDDPPPDSAMPAGP